jgi:glycosyltransferase involved in cell wall biosynthesis
MKIAMLAIDSRELLRRYGDPDPLFAPVVAVLAQSLARNADCEVHYVCCYKQPVRSPDLLAENLYYHSVVVPPWGWLRGGYVGCVRAVRRKLTEIKPAVVHGQGTERYCALAAARSGYPNVITVHGNMAELARLFRARFGSYLWLAGRLENYALKKTAGVFCNSAYTEELVRPRAARTWRVPNAIDARFLETPKTALPREKCRLLNVGVIGERKRQLELLAAAGQLHQQGLSFELHFLGQAETTSSYAAKFLAQIQEAERQGYARYLGFKPHAELIGHFDAAHGLVHFPSEEAFGLVVAEALARGLKFFGARLGGIVDIAQGVPDAELFEPDDWPGLAGAIGKWMRSGHPRPPGSAEIMAARYHPSLVARRHLEIYREVLQTTGLEVPHEPDHRQLQN